MRVLVTGDREWDDRLIIETVIRGLADYDDLTVIEGGARGADRIAGDWAAYAGVDYEEYPAKWSEHGKSAGPIRNRQMLKEGNPDIVVAFHNDLDNSKGTKDMVAAAVKAGVPVYHVRRVNDDLITKQRVEEIIARFTKKSMPT